MAKTRRKEVEKQEKQKEAPAHKTRRDTKQQVSRYLHYEEEPDFIEVERIRRKR